MSFYSLLLSITRVLVYQTTVLHMLVYPVNLFSSGLPRFHFPSNSQQMYHAKQTWSRFTSFIELGENLTYSVLYLIQIIIVMLLGEQVVSHSSDTLPVDEDERGQLQVRSVYRRSKLSHRRRRRQYVSHRWEVNNLIITHEQ